MAWGDRTGNVRKADAMIDVTPGADLYIFPEMFTTGFSMDTENMAEDEDGETLSLIHI